LALFNKTNVMYMTTFVSRKINILCIMFKIRTLIGKHLYDHVISRRGRYGQIKLV
jgi:hypothetical protein